MIFNLGSIWSDGNATPLPNGVTLEIHHTTRRDIGTLSGYYSFAGGHWRSHRIDNTFDAKRNPAILDEWVYAIEDALVTSDNHIYTADGTQLIGTGWAIKNDVIHDQAALKSDAIRVDETVIFAGMNAGYVYGHWLLHVMPRVVRMRQLFGDIPALVPLTPWDSTPHHTLAGLSEDKAIHIAPAGGPSGIGAVRVSRLLVTNQIVLNPGINAERFDHVLTQFDFESSLFAVPEKLFVARKAGPSTHRTGMANSDEVAEMMENFGFTIFYPEDHSWKDQISHFRGARVVVGETGSSMHTAIFAGSDLTVVDITPLADLSKREWQRRIAQYRGQRYGIILGEREAMKKGWVANLETVRAAIGSLDVVLPH